MRVKFNNPPETDVRNSTDLSILSIDKSQGSFSSQPSRLPVQSVLKNQRATTKLGQRREKRTPFVFSRGRPVVPFDPNSVSLKRFISEHFSDDQLIDFDYEHREYDRSIKNLSFKLLDSELQGE